MNKNIEKWVDIINKPPFKRLQGMVSSYKYPIVIVWGKDTISSEYHYDNLLSSINDENGITGIWAIKDEWLHEWQIYSAQCYQILSKSCDYSPQEYADIIEDEMIVDEYYTI